MSDTIKKGAKKGVRVRRGVVSAAMRNQGLQELVTGAILFTGKGIRYSRMNGVCFWTSATGIWAMSAPDARAFTASPWGYDGKIFCLSEDGATFLIQAGPEMKVLAKNSLGEMCMSSPDLVPGALIVRTTQALYRIGIPQRDN